MITRATDFFYHGIHIWQRLNIFCGMSEQQNLGNVCTNRLKWIMINHQMTSRECCIRLLSIYLTTNWSRLFKNFDDGFMIPL